MSSAELVLLAANAVYGTAYVAMRPAVDAAGPVTLAFLRLAIAFAIIAPLGLGARGAAAFSGADRRALFWMGFLGFTLAMALTHWGLAWSTATNAALLIATEPIALVVLAPIVLGEEGRPAVGALALARLSEAPAWRRVAVRELGPDLWESYERAS